MTLDRFRNVRRPNHLPLTDTDLARMFEQLAPGQGLIYHRGFLACDRNAANERGRDVNRAARTAMRLGAPAGAPILFVKAGRAPMPTGLGLGRLVQIPLGDGTWEYVIIKRAKPGDILNSEK